MRWPEGAQRYGRFAEWLLLGKVYSRLLNPKRIVIASSHALSFSPGRPSTAQSETSPSTFEPGHMLL